MNKTDAELLAKDSCGVYQIRCLVNGKMYVGGTVDLRRRFLKHLRELRAGTHHSRKLQRAWSKYGEEAFVFEILESATRETLQETEQRWLDKTQAASKLGGYNICPEGRIRLGVPHSPETRAKISASHKGRKLSEEQIQGMRERMLGHVHSQDALERIRSASLGRKHSKESKRKIGAAHKDKTVSDETRAKISRANKGKQTWLGKEHTKETKERLRLIAEARATKEYRDLARDLMHKRWDEDDGTLREKIASAVSKAHRGKVISEETKEKMKAGMRAAWARRKRLALASSELCRGDRKEPEDESDH